MKNEKGHWLLTFAFLVFIGLIVFFFNGQIKRYGDSAMVLITAVYVVATIEICRANMKAAEATREQIEESKRQFEDTRRLSVMPEFQAEVENTNSVMVIPDITLAIWPSNESFYYSTTFVLTLHNIGFGAAKEITYSWENVMGKFNRGDFSRLAVMPKEAESVVVEVLVASDKISDISPYWTGTITLAYKDLLNNCYEQEIDLLFSIFDNKVYDEDGSLAIRSCTTHPTTRSEHETKETTNV